MHYVIIEPNGHPAETKSLTEFARYRGFALATVTIRFHYQVMHKGWREDVYWQSVSQSVSQSVVYCQPVSQSVSRILPVSQSVSQSYIASQSVSQSVVYCHSVSQSVSRILPVSQSVSRILAAPCLTLRAPLSLHVQRKARPQLCKSTRQYLVRYREKYAGFHAKKDVEKYAGYAVFRRIRYTEYGVRIDTAFLR